MSKKLIVFIDDDEIEEFYGDDLTVEVDGENSNSIGNPILKVKKGYNYIAMFLEWKYWVLRERNKVDVEGN